MTPEQRNLAHSVLVLATALLIGIAFIDQLIGNPAAIS